MKDLMILSSEDFKKSVKDHYYSMDLKEIFRIEKRLIDTEYSAWETFYFDSDYKSYVAMLFGLPENMSIFSMDQVTFKVARKIAHRLIVYLAESYYYDSVIEGVEGSFSNPKSLKIKGFDIIQYMDLLDIIYSRFSDDISTIDMIRNTMGQDYIEGLHTDRSFI